MCLSQYLAMNLTDKFMLTLLSITSCNSIFHLVTLLLLILLHNGKSWDYSLPTQLSFSSVNHSPFLFQLSLSLILPGGYIWFHIFGPLCFIKNIWHFKTVCWCQCIFFLDIWFIFTFCSYRVSTFLNVTSILSDTQKIWPVIGKMLSMLTLLWVKSRSWNEAACLPSGAIQTKGGYNKEENYRFSQEQPGFWCLSWKDPQWNTYPFTPQEMHPLLQHNHHLWK